MLSLTEYSTLYGVSAGKNNTSPGFVNNRVFPISNAPVPFTRKDNAAYGRAFTSKTPF
jgi:hypothetical protein